SRFQRAEILSVTVLDVPAPNVWRDRVAAVANVQTIARAVRLEESLFLAPGTSLGRLGRPVPVAVLSEAVRGALSESPGRDRNDGSQAVLDRPGGHDRISSTTS